MTAALLFVCGIFGGLSWMPVAGGVLKPMTAHAATHTITLKRYASDPDYMEVWVDNVQRSNLHFGNDLQLDLYGIASGDVIDINIDGSVSLYEIIFPDNTNVTLKPIGNNDRLSVRTIDTIRAGVTVKIEAGLTVVLTDSSAKKVQGKVINGGTLEASYLWITDTGSLVNNGTLNTTSELNIMDNATLTNNGTMTSQGSLNVLNKSTFTNNRTFKGDGYVWNSGTVNNTGTMTNTGTFTNNNGTINNSGTLTNSRDFNNNGTINNSGTLTNSSNFNNNGTINVTGNGVINGITGGIIKYPPQLPAPAPAAPASSCASGHASYTWQTVTEPDVHNDGEEICVCEGCGQVLYRVPLSAYGPFQKVTAEKIRNSAPGATVEITTSRWYSFHKSVMEALAARPDVTLVISFLSEGYKGDRLILTIPAGTDTVGLLNEDGYAGFFYISWKLGTLRPAN